MMTAQERYISDPLFRMLTDQVYRIAEMAHRDGSTFTPTELREAAMLASLMFEERHVRPMFLHRPFAAEETT